MTTDSAAATILNTNEAHQTLISRSASTLLLKPLSNSPLPLTSPGNYSSKPSSLAMTFLATLMAPNHVRHLP
ncbi:hypothetical protein CsSME_00020471 [Camellia sinensis var. sinensis]